MKKMKDKTRTATNALELIIIKLPTQILVRFNYRGK